MSATDPDSASSPARGPERREQHVGVWENLRWGLLLIALSVLVSQLARPLLALFGVES